MSDYAIGATPAPVSRGRPWKAGLLGASLGPLGVAFATDTLIDPVLSGTVYLGLSLKWGGWGMVVGLGFCAAYNVARIRYRNAQAAAAERAEARHAAAAMARPALLLSAPEVIETVALPPVVLSIEPAPNPVLAPVTVEPSPAPVAVDTPALPEPPAPAPVELPATVPEPAAEIEPPAPPVPPAPRKRGRPKGSRKLAA